MNKENVGVVANALKQLSVNKPSRSDLDAHLELIHTTQEEIQTQLHNIEVQSTQTSVDLAQLFDRSKNNNQNLNRLLENVVAYSKEVMTEGNATKADMNRILEKLEKLESSGQEITRLEFEKMSKELLEGLNSQYKDQGNYIENLKESQLEFKESLREEVNQIDSSLSEVNNISQGLSVEVKKIQDKLNGLNEKIPNINHIIDPIVQEVKTSDTKLNTILHEISNKINQVEKPQNYNEQFDLITNKLSQLEQTRKEQDEKEQNQLATKQKELESKINQLESKYATLCNEYTQKFQDYKTLNEKYTELVHQIEEIDIPTDMTRLKKVRQFHSTKQNTNLLVKQKRIASTPVSRSNDTDFINNSDEGF